MSFHEFKNNINLIRSFSLKLHKEPIPIKAQKTMLKFYAKTLRINLTDKMLDDFIYTNIKPLQMIRTAIQQAY
ncbi:hypothetical protein [Alkaliphilus peptidifermentans]|uniref:Uncharacterized protein n=1 Tax=Alkaliphilus peptidifermentans DSM 18978 TaxID=1120976 RepID=A0A1G5JT18_9FIRM|nr:hypothetical protein [Alkaliphilus peptidifermentans]SCY91486.1 hypothetical protein SAMN03080606_03039 [Alkaliphilus peptidifermentans DSM 18978]